MDTSRAPPRPSYTCLVRLPFPRGDFVDPPPVEWDATKDKALWKIISKAANSKDLDWPDLSNRFQVSLSFLLQQAAWLYERHFAQMRAQMKKLGASAAPSPVPSQDALAAAPQRPTSRAPSALSVHTRDSPSLPSGSIISPVRPNPPPISRTPSTRTVTQSRYPSSQHEIRPYRPSFNTARRPSALEDATAAPSPHMASSSSSAISSSSDERPIHPSVAKSQVFRRPPDLRTISSDGDAEDDEGSDDSSSAGFLPFASREHHSTSTNQTATIRQSASGRASGSHQADSLATRRASNTASGTQAPGRAALTIRPAPGGAGPDTLTPTARTVSGPAAGKEAFSPRRKTELMREGSEGSPSMGSSFSDLDDSSVTKSALEDALLSNMQAHGGSRISTFSQALRSRYLPQ